MHKPTVSDPRVYRVYVLSPISFPWGCLTCVNYVETIFIVKLEVEQNMVFQNYVLAVYNK